MAWQYECVCMSCGAHRTITFREEPYPKPKEVFTWMCHSCGCNTDHTRAMTRKTLAELRRAQKEEDLRNSIVQDCEQYGFSCRFLYQSVIITTPISDWCFDYHTSRITLYHESTVKINFATGDYAKSHRQFTNRKMTPHEVIAYIASHDAWRAKKDSYNPTTITSRASDPY